MNWDNEIQLLNTKWNQTMIKFFTLEYQQSDTLFKNQRLLQSNYTVDTRERSTNENDTETEQTTAQTQVLHTTYPSVSYS